jgi:hypothetical protein
MTVRAILRLTNKRAPITPFPFVPFLHPLRLFAATRHRETLAAAVSSNSSFEFGGQPANSSLPKIRVSVDVMEITYASDG